MSQHKGVLQGPMETAQLVHEWRMEKLAETLKPYPNLAAIMVGTVSGSVTEWPAIRAELSRLVMSFSETVNERDELRAQLTPPTMTPEEEAESLELENTRHEREQELSYDAGYNAGWAAASREYAGDE